MVLLGFRMRVCLLVSIFAVSFGGVAHAASIVVNDTNDELNTDGSCSLREAIEAANTDTAVDGCAAGNGADVITLPAGTYTGTTRCSDAPRPYPVMRTSLSPASAGMRATDT